MIDTARRGCTISIQDRAAGASVGKALEEDAPHKVFVNQLIVLSKRLTLLVVGFTAFQFPRKSDLASVIGN
jgi:hypothetical protein